MGHAREAVEAAKTVVEVAELAWHAAELLHHNNHPDHPNNSSGEPNCPISVEEFKDIRDENRRLKELLEQNLKLLHTISSSPSFLTDCPPDLHERLVTAVDSKCFLTRLQSLRDGSVNGAEREFPFKEPTGEDLEAVEVLINVDQEEPSWWVWVTDSMVPGAEERSGIDDDNYVVVCEEHVVDGVANFLARCIVSNPKLQKLTPEELQKTLTSSLGGMNKVEKMLNIWHAGKMFYALSTWGLALAGLYQSRAVLKLAAHGVHHTSKLVLKAM
ncbi:hypothetical protein SOVF_014910 [Spinacia oleracea]|uniref:Uncharacterized protein n=1 Tax=Spinacia oleracea TaxID=3562 RepID=A0A9R0K5C9_SPIOL|nr:uncharacterized protein LOC110798198 [Spinacia oleracea]KNA24494.1 hypothetical protein SOVF_014910 [Spinacia oleracea]